MNNESTLTARQLMIFIFLISMGTTILIVPSILAAQSKQDAWIAGIAAVGAGLLFIWLYVKLAQMFPAMTLFDMNEQVLGKWIGKAVTLFYIYMMFVLSAQVLFYIGTFMTTQIMPTTPIQSIYILMITFTVIGAKLGVIILGRTAEIFFPSKLHIHCPSGYVYDRLFLFSTRIYRLFNLKRGQIPCKVRQILLLWGDNKRNHDDYHHITRHPGDGG